MRSASWTTREPDPRAWIKPFYRCNMWHIQGRDFDLLFDTGLGHFPLRKTIAALRERPVICVASHSHFDHIGLPPRIRSPLHPSRRGRDPRRPPANEWTLADRYATVACSTVRRGLGERPIALARTGDQLLSDGEVIDLGRPRVRGHPIARPFHRAASPCGTRTGILLSGDIIYDGP